MSATSDRVFLTTQTSTLLRPLFSHPNSISPSLPPALLTALNSTISRSLKLKYAPSAARQAVDQLGELRGREWRRSEKRREKARAGLVVVKKDVDFVGELGGVELGDSEDGER